MRFKNFTLLFLMGIFGLFTTNLFAQDATIDPADIRWWVGEGENEVVVAISWCSYTETAFAWGYRFDGEATVFQALSAIASADDRLTVVGSAPTNITYVDDEYDLTMCPNPDASYGDVDYDIPMHSVNGLMGQNMMSAEPIQNNDFVKIGGYACGTMSSDWTTISWTTEITPAVDPNAPVEVVDATISADEIKYWIGEGENEVIFIVNWAEPDTALAWGYRFSGESVTVETMMDDIAAADSRFSYVGANNWLDDLQFNDGVLDLSLEGMWWMYIVSGEMAQLGYAQQTVVDGDYVKWGDESCGILLDPSMYTYVWTKEVAPVYPLADEAMIDFEDILYWVGEGENEVVLAVNWNEPNKCLAWGYRFNEEEVTVETVMDAIAEADGRFAYDGSNGWLSDITYNDGELNLALAGMYFMYNVNGYAAWYGYNEQTVVNGDFIKWGDESCGTEIAPWTYVWTQTVEPVSVYDAVNENINTLAIYPNPAISETFVTVENTGVNAVSVYDMQGRLVISESVNAMAGEKVRLSTEMLNAGVYFVTVSSDNAVSTAKLVVR